MPTIVKIDVVQTLTIELTQADKIALKAMLYRNPWHEQSKTMPVFKVDAVKYIRERFNLGLKNAKDFADHIHNNIWIVLN